MGHILKRKVEKHHVSNIQQLCDVIMEEWKRMPATTCAALVNSMPRRIKAVLDNNSAPTKWQFFQIYTLNTVLTCSLIFVASYLDNNGFVELYLENIKFVLLYKLHIDYYKIYPSFICAVLSLEKLHKNFSWNVRGVLTFVRYCTYIYIYAPLKYQQPYNSVRKCNSSLRQLLQFQMFW